MKQKILKQGTSLLLALCFLLTLLPLGAVAEETSGRTIYPESYGAVGDGVTDDREAFLKFLEADGVHTLTAGKRYLVGALTLTEDLYLEGNGGTLLSDSRENPLIDDRGGYNVTLVNVNFEDNESSATKALVSVGGTGDLTMQNCTVTKNYAGGWAVCFAGGNLLVDGCTFNTRNAAETSDGVHIMKASSAVIQNSTFDTGDDAIAVFLQDDIDIETGNVCDVYVNNCHISTTYSAVKVGAYANVEASKTIGKVILNDCTIDQANRILTYDEYREGAASHTVEFNRCNVDAYTMPKQEVTMTVFSAGIGGQNVVFNDCNLDFTDAPDSGVVCGTNFSNVEFYNCEIALADNWLIGGDSTPVVVIDGGTLNTNVELFELYRVQPKSVTITNVEVQSAYYPFFYIAQDVPVEVSGNTFYVNTVCAAAGDNVAVYNNKYVLGDTTHTITMINASAATATKAGYTGDFYCTDCGKVIAEGITLPATGGTTEPEEPEERTYAKATSFTEGKSYLLVVNNKALGSNLSATAVTMTEADGTYTSNLDENAVLWTYEGGKLFTEANGSKVYLSASGSSLTTDTSGVSWTLSGNYLYTKVDKKFLFFKYQKKYYLSVSGSSFTLKSWRSKIALYELK